MITPNDDRKAAEALAAALVAAQARGPSQTPPSVTEQLKSMREAMAGESLRAREDLQRTFEESRNQGLALDLVSERLNEPRRAQEAMAEAVRRGNEPVYASIVQLTEATLKMAAEQERQAEYGRIRDKRSDDFNVAMLVVGVGAIVVGSVIAFLK